MAGVVNVVGLVFQLIYILCMCGRGELEWRERVMSVRLQSFLHVQSVFQELKQLLPLSKLLEQDSDGIND